MGKTNGFSHMKVLIVVAVIAGSVAAMTPITINAVKKANATKVADEITMIAEGIRAAATRNGVFRSDFRGVEVDLINGHNSAPHSWEDAISLAYFERKIDGTLYEVLYKVDGGKIEVIIGFAGRVEIDLVRDLIPEVTSRAQIVDGRAFVWEGGEYFPVIGCDPAEFPSVWYRFSVSMN